MPKAKKVEPDIPGADEPTYEDTTPVAKTKQTTFTVLNSGGDPVRDYTGPDAEDNANEYAKKIGGSVK